MQYALCWAEMLFFLFDSSCWGCWVGEVRLWGEYFAALSHLWETSQDFLMCSSSIVDNIWYVILHRTVLVPKGWFKGEEWRSGWKKKKKLRNGVVHCRHRIPGDAEASSSFYMVDMTEVVYRMQPTRMWSCSCALLPLCGFFILVLLLLSWSSCFLIFEFVLILFMFSNVSKLKSVSLCDVVRGGKAYG
jgi:hypothetical protein